MTDTIRQAYDKALAATLAKDIPEAHRHMVACLAVKDAMDDTLENLIALRDVMRMRVTARAKVET